MKLIWQKSGDFIEIQPLNLAVAEYFFENCKKINQNIFYSENKINTNQILEDLVLSLKKINEIFELFKINDLKLSISFNQDELNLLHERWVLINRKYPMLGSLIEKKQKGSKKCLDEINILIHELETSFELTLTNNSSVYFVNNFGPEVTSFDKANIFLAYKNLGRQSYDKFINFDKSTKNLDRNDFIELGGYIKINLQRPQSVPVSPDYISWCNNNNIVFPYGDKINLGNFLNIEENLTKYRQLFNKNFCLEKNEVIFEL